MRPAPGIRVTVGAAHRALPLILAARALILSGPAAATAQQNDPGPARPASPKPSRRPAAHRRLTIR